MSKHCNVKYGLVLIQVVQVLHAVNFSLICQVTIKKENYKLNVLALAKETKKRLVQTAVTFIALSGD